MASNKYHKWLAEESATWVADGLLSAEQVDALKTRYPASGGLSWGVYVLSAMGAGLFGLGIILFFAYNWADLHKFAKLALIFTALIGTHLLGVFFNRKTQLNKDTFISSRTNLSESFHVLGTFMFGAGIWLIAQIYHMDEHYPNALAFWGIGTLALAWALPSVIQGLIAAVLISTWGFAETTDYGQEHHLSYLVMVFGVLTLAWYLKSRALLFVALIGSIGLFIANFVEVFIEGSIIHILFALTILLLSVSVWARKSSFPESDSVFRLIGVVAYAFFLMLFTFDDISEEVYRVTQNAADYRVTLAICVVALLVWVVSAIMQNKQSGGRTQALQLFLVGLTALTVVCSLLRIEGLPFFAFPLAFNSILAAHGVLLIISGTNEVRWRQVAIGSLIIMFLAAFRFNDLFDSLLMRSLAFVVVGTTLFFIGHIYSKSSPKKKNEPPISDASKLTQSEVHHA